MQDYFRSLPLSRGSVILDHYIQCRVLTAEEGVSMEQKVSDIESSLARCLQADEQQKNWAFRNLILYKIWENNFPTSRMSTRYARCILSWRNMPLLSY